MTTHTYGTTLSWSGRTGAGYHGYSRTHSAVVGAATIPLSADPAFRGDGALPNPEQLLLAAASSCQLLSFLAVAALRHLDVHGYTDAATATMDDAGLPARIDAIHLAPTIHVAHGTDRMAVLDAVAAAHRQCYVASTLACEVTIDATVVDR